ncbi:MAG: hypothetical protein JWN70_1590, partial [Planctomycetaceae bacterium]|nr:hypothetical protein [Planctomycetaceae bacterium]
MFVFRFFQLLTPITLATRPVRRRRELWRSEIVEALESRVVPAALTVTPLDNPVTTESGGQAHFSVVLDSQPTATVTVPIKSLNIKEGTVNVKQLVFTSANWSTPQTFTVKGVEDTLIDGDKSYQVSLGKFKSKDKAYKALPVITKTLTNIDNDVPAIQVTAGSNLQTTEGGGKATFTVRLATKPTANVVIPLQSSNTLEGTVTSSLTFTPLNWNKTQTVTITGVNDSQIDGPQAYQITFQPAQSSDAAYNGKTASAVSVTNADNDVAGVSITAKTGLTINEGASQDVSFKLTAQPTSDVTVTFLTTVGDDQATSSVSSLTFTPANWNVAQNVTITGTTLDGIDGNKPFTFTVDTASDDALFNALPTQTVTVIINDTEAPPPNYNGVYTGTYSGHVTIAGFPISRSGNIA